MSLYNRLTSISIILFLTDSLEKCQTKSFENMNTLLYESETLHPLTNVPILTKNIQELVLKLFLTYLNQEKITSRTH